MFAPQVNPKDIADAFVKVSFQEEKDGDPLFEQWVDQASAKHSSPDLLLSKVLQKLYPNHSLVMTRDSRMDLLAFPHVYVQPLSPSELVTNLIFVPLPRNSGPVPGALVNSVEFGGFRVAWSNYEFIVYIAKWPMGFGVVQQFFILHDGGDDPIKDMLLSAGLWQDQLHQEIWVFNQGFWQKDRGLWQAIQSASWDDVILEEDFKSALQKDVFGFFSARETYKKLSLPWKRGLILHGPPGNGKTISIKVIMKACSDLGYSPMYVKSFKSWMGEEGSMAEVFAKARQNSPCVVILEDLDSHINDQNRSFFLNELDGLSGNDGLLVIGTTNHFDRLDPGLSTRPSRFDRKYLFDDPNRAARLLYTQYWQGKLESNDAVSFPDSLAREIADTTQSFSFAYLKEAFVSALVILLTDQEDGKDTTFEIAIKQQIKTLRRQLDKGLIGNLTGVSLNATPMPPPAAAQAALQSADTPFGRSVQHLLDVLKRNSGGPVYTSTPFTATDPRIANVRAALDQITQGGSAGARWM